jgi:hypothetical protein
MAMPKGLALLNEYMVGDGIGDGTTPPEEVNAVGSIVTLLTPKLVTHTLPGASIAMLAGRTATTGVV